MVGSFLGWRGVILSLVVSFVVGAFIAGLVAIERRSFRNQRVPFGPFFALGALLVTIYGEDLIRFYLEFIHWNN